VQPPWIERIRREAGLPLNIMVSQKTPPVADLAALGVARISLAVWPFEFVRARLRLAMDEFARTKDFRIFLPGR